MDRRVPGFAVAAALCLLTAGGLPGSPGPTAELSDPTGPTAELSDPTGPTSEGSSAPDPVGTVEAPAWFVALDSLARETMEDRGIPGLALIGVQNGEVFLRAHGHADLERERPVDPRRTRFAVGSVSKVVTAATVLSLVEAGTLDLDRDVNLFLRRPLVPEAFGHPVTLRHLLTHTSGLESRNLGLVAREPDETRSLEDFLGEELPVRTLPPGRVYVYSQHGYGLAGLAVENVEGARFAEVARARILRPAGMEESGFEPGDLLHPDLAKGYIQRSGGLESTPLSFHHLPPAGGLTTTPADLGRLMAALLATGSGPAGAPAAESGPLGEAALRTLHSRHYAPHPHPAVEGTALGLFEHRHGTRRALTTRGWTGGHSTYVHLVPELGIGMAFVTNAWEARGLEEALRDLLNRRLPPNAEGGGARTVAVDGEEPPVADAAPISAAEGGSETSRLTGRYRVMNFASTGIESVGRAFLAPQIQVSAGDDGGLNVDFGSSQVSLTRVAPLLYRTSWQEGRDQHFAFLTDEDGRAGHLQWGVMTFEKVAWHDTDRAHRILIGLFALAFLSGIAVPAGRGILRRMGRGGPDRLPSGAVGLAGLASGLNLLFLVGVGAHLIGPDRYLLAYGLPATLEALLWVPLLAGGLAVGMVMAAPAVWRTRSSSRALRLHYQLLSVAALGFVAYLFRLGLLAPPL